MIPTDSTRPSEPSPLVVWFVAALLVLALGWIAVTALSADRPQSPVVEPVVAAPGSSL